ncbi:MAG: M23 family metallopeptidase [candidate division Zixibacteria bacterium]|nr:M23 family metallopeptidase [candidate division Zixibacteria bacterium]
MPKVSTTTASWFIVIILLFSTGYAEVQPWPLKQNIDLSSGFGDFRANRFHAGLDLRTGGRTGRWVYSPVDGYIQRIKMSYGGYGKGLYVRGDDGYTYVFAHLNRFEGKIQDVVQFAQHEVERYFVDLVLPADSLPVKQGDRIAVSGQTGAGAPHLHFEKRDNHNRPVNPLLHGFELKEKVRPTFTRVGFHLRDRHSIFANGQRRQFFDVQAGQGQGQFRLDTVLFFDSPFGVLADCFDQMKPGGMKQAVYSLTLEIDGDRYYESVFDRLEFEIGRSVNLEYDPHEAAEGNSRVRRMYHRKGNDFDGSRARNKHDGLFGVDGKGRYGLHEALVTAKDVYGNTSQLSFTFLWGPSRDMYVLDSMHQVEATVHDFYFTPRTGFDELGIDSIQVQFNSKGEWGKTPSAEVLPLDDNRIRVRVTAKLIRAAQLRLYVFAQAGCGWPQEPFNGFHRMSPVVVEDFSYEATEDGLLVHIKGPQKYGSSARIELFYRDSLLGREFETRFIGNDEHHIFVPADPRYHRIDRIGMATTKDTTEPAVEFVDAAIVLAGLQPADTLAIDSVFSLTAGRDNVYEPRYLGITKSKVIARTRWRLASDLYEITPAAFAARQDFNIELLVPPDNPQSRFAGLCWLDEKKNNWVWVNADSLPVGVTGGLSTGGGKFAAVHDFDPPTIRDLNVVPGRLVESLRPTIEFMLSDTLSGIADDRSIDVRLNKQWCIVEYDPESERCTAQPYLPLEEGDCHLALIVTDRAGNKTEQYMIFNVVKPKERKSGK